MNGSFLFNETSLRILGRGLLTLRNHIPALNNSTLLINEDFQDLASLSFIFTSVDINSIAFLYMQLCHFCLY